MNTFRIHTLCTWVIWLNVLLQIIFVLTGNSFGHLIFGVGCVVVNVFTLRNVGWWDYYTASGKQVAAEAERRQKQWEEDQKLSHRTHITEHVFWEVDPEPVVPRTPYFQEQLG